jgi:hypothetical protein
MKCLRKLWNDEAGFIVSTELVLVATIVVIGLIVGLAVLRNQVVQELVDTGMSIGSISQSWALSGTKKPGVAWTDGGGYTDIRDFCQPDTTQTPGKEPGGVAVHDLMPSIDWQGYDIPSSPLGRERF